MIITGKIEDHKTEPEIRPSPEEYGSSKDIAFTVPQGTPYVVKINLHDHHGWEKAVKNRYCIADALVVGDKAIFGIKKHPDDNEYIFKKTVIYENEGDLSECGKFTVKLTETDTAIEPGIYYYSVAAAVAEPDPPFSPVYSSRLQRTKPIMRDFVEIIPPVPFRIRPMMIKKSDMQEVQND